MNKSHFVTTLKEEYQVSIEAIWRSAIDYKAPRDVNRAYDDTVEAEFWESFSKEYDSIPSLIDYAPETFDKLIELVGKGRSAIEFGCGTGKFTIPMSKHCESIVGVDFSKDMLEVLSHKIRQENIENVELFHSKFEAAVLAPVDCIYGINANYRMLDIKSAITKMSALAKERVIFVWTMQRNIYDALLNQSPIKGIKRGQEYIHLINILYEMGIDPSMEMMTVSKPIDIEDIEEHYKALKELSKSYGLSYEPLKEAFEKALISCGDRLIYNCKLKVAFIYFDCSN